MNQFYAVSDNYFTILEKIPRFVTYEKMLFLAKKKLSESHQRQVLCHPENSYISQRNSYISSQNMLYYPCLQIFGASITLGLIFKEPAVFFKCKPVTKIKYQINVCILFIKTQILMCNRWADNGNCNCNRNEKNKCKPLQTKKEPYLPK